MAKKTIEDIQVSGKKVLVRCDFNVPLDANKNITDENRIKGALPTIQYLIDHGAKVILCSHLGRPKGEFNMKYSLAPVAARLTQLLGKEVKLAKDVVGEDAQKLASELKDGDVMMLENVRFHKEEEKNDPEFAKQLASLAEVYVNDAFGTAHRAHASTCLLYTSSFRALIPSAGMEAMSFPTRLTGDGNDEENTSLFPVPLSPAGRGSGGGGAGRDARGGHHGAM